MNKKILSGILYGGAGSFWWGVIGVIYFKYVAFVGALELVVHRTIWTTLILLLTTLFFSRWKNLFKVLKNKKKVFILFTSGLLIFTNWSIWIYAVVTNRLIDGSFGYYIFPILSVFFGYIFFKEKLNFMRIFISIIYFLFSFNSIPWIGLSVAIIWSTYNLLRKKANVETDIGLFIETLFLTPIAIIIFYFITKNGLNDFNLSNVNIINNIFSLEKNFNFKKNFTDYFFFKYNWFSEKEINNLFL